MNYKEAVRYLNSFIDYEKIGYRDRQAFKLDRMRCLARLFGNPENSFPAIHVTGTKGKGSIAAFTANILKEAGFNTGLYTSPHLVTPRERIKLNGEMINEHDFTYHAERIKRKLEREKLDFSPTFFEIYTILAFNYFKAKKINYAVIEVGLGGRLDATNIVSPLVAVISPISREHTLILGNTLEKIAREKSGIIKKGCVLVSAPQKEGALSVIRKKCKSLATPLVLIGKDIDFKEIHHDCEKEVFNIMVAPGEYRHCVSRLLGYHQIVNSSCAVGAIEALKKKGARVSEENIKKGIETTINPGRFEIISKNPYIVLDGAQNRESARALKETVKRNLAFKRLILVLGISKDKDMKGIAGELAPLADIIILTKAKIARAEDPHVIKALIKNKNAIVTHFVSNAVKKAEALAGSEDLILVTGSFFVIGEAKEGKSAKEKLGV